MFVQEIRSSVISRQLEINEVERGLAAWISSVEVCHDCRHHCMCLLCLLEDALYTSRHYVLCINYQGSNVTVSILTHPLLC